MNPPTATELIEDNYGTRDNTRIAEGTLDWGKYDPSLQSAWISPNGSRCRINQQIRVPR